MSFSHVMGEIGRVCKEKWARTIKVVGRSVSLKNENVHFFFCGPAAGIRLS